MDKKEIIKELDIVALLEDIPGKHLSKGAIGTIVHVYDNNFYEVEFADLNGHADDEWNFIDSKIKNIGANETAEVNE